MISIEVQYQQNDINDVATPTHNTSNIPITTQRYQYCSNI